jgi:ubiquinone/menaquinone biosynthesis C-methylase UbiE
MKTNIRFAWAAGVVAPRPTDHVLEIGCGAGLLVEQLTRRLTTGTLTAVDRSAAMIRRATERNQAALAAGKATFRHGDFLRVPLPERAYDKAVAFNVNFFWQDPAQELRRLKNVLVPQGLLFIFHQTPNGRDTEAAARIGDHLRRHSFLVQAVLYKDKPAAPPFCIITTPG